MGALKRLHSYRSISLLALLPLLGCTSLSAPAGDAAPRGLAQISAYVSEDDTEESANRCATSPTEQFLTGLPFDPGYVGAYRSGTLAPALGSGLVHHQSIQRILRNGKNYLIVSDSTEYGTPAGLEIVELASTGSRSEALGPNVEIPSFYPPSSDRVVAYLGDPVTWRDHAGGIQALGRFVITPFENSAGAITAGFRIADLSDPLSPRWSPSTPRMQGLTTTAGAASIIRLADGRYLALVFGRNSSDVEVFLSTRAAMPALVDPTSAWLSVAALETPSEFEAYQNAQLVADCQGSIYLLATYRSSLTCKHWADLYSVRFSQSFSPTFTKIGSRHFRCASPHTGGAKYCDFSAGAGAYVSAKGRLALYGVELYNSNTSLIGNNKIVRFREFF